MVKSAFLLINLCRLSQLDNREPWNRYRRLSKHKPPCNVHSSPNRCVRVTGSPPVCLATCMRCVPTCGWSTWLCISSFSAGWSTTSSSAIKWVSSSRTSLPTLFGCQSWLLLRAAVVQRRAHIVNSSCDTALLVSHPLTTVESYVISTIGFIMYYLVLFYLFYLSFLLLFLYSL